VNWPSWQRTPETKKRNNSDAGCGFPIIYPKGSVMDRIITWGAFFLVLIVGLGFVA
jgi:hypothetical protein